MNNNKNKFAINIAVSFVFIIALAFASFGQKNDANAAQTQTVNAQQSGQWTVGIDPSKNTVQLNNTPQNPLSVKVENAAKRTPFQKRVIVVPTGNGFVNAILQIPAGKRLVIENLSVISRIPEGLKAEVNFFSYMDNDGNGVNDPEDLTFHRVPMIEQGVFDGTAISAFNQKMLVFADGNIGGVAQSLHAQARLNGALPQNTFTQVQFTFSGYLEDLPAGQ